jgi:putative component of membrane protein insertase Oxa1/YidC/SpoIIIJ protein YidD
MAIEKETWTATGVDADMPTHRMLLILVGYIFCNRSDCPRHDENGVSRPRIKKGKAVAVVALHLVIGVLGGALAAHSLGIRPLSISVAVLVSAYMMAVAVFFRSRIVIWMIRLYQFRAPEEIRAKCVMTPCCSNYMVLAIEQYGLLDGVSRGVARLRRCGPPARIDYP